MSYDEYLTQTAGIIQIISNVTICNTNSPVRIVFADCITPEIRGRKPFIEFPVGIDSIGQSLLRAGHSIDYAFLPPEKLRNEMHSSGELLQTLGLYGNQRLPVRQACLLGISMMNYLQTPSFFTLLSLSGIPLHRTGRTVHDPIIVLGGHIWPNPLPLSEFYDVMVVGDGEDVMAAIAQTLTIRSVSREEQLAAIANITDAYVPGYSRAPIQRAPINFADEKYAAGSSIIMDGSAALILSRGCTHACAFCNCSQVGGSYREKPFSHLIRQLDLFSLAGVRRIMLCAIAAASYCSEGRTISDIISAITSRGMEVRGMSDLPETFTAGYLESTIKPGGKAIIAIEAHPVIRKKVLLKNLSEAEINHAIEKCIEARIERIQFYAILAIPPISPGIVEHLPQGFAGENGSHLQYFADIARSTIDRMRRAGIASRDNQPAVIIDCMPLIPAIGTRLQTISFPQWQEYIRKIVQLQSMVQAVPNGLIKITAGLDELSYLLQAVLERGGSSAGACVFSACCKAGFEVPSPEMVRGELDEYGIDISSFQNEIPADQLPYAGMLAEADCHAKETRHGT
jgi:hypothetical protein